MSEWTSKYAIMRDLAVAQGFDVPADLEGIGANEKPPALNIPEDTGEDYFGHGVGEGDHAEPPDLLLIKQMLDMVRDVGVSSEDDSPEHVVQITKPCSLNIGIDVTNSRTGTVPKTIQNKDVKAQVTKVKKKRENVAVNSILAMAGDSPIPNMETPREPLKLLKPEDFITEDIETEIVQSVEKVNGWLDTQVPGTSVPRFSGNPLLLEPGSMFKRKSSSTIKSPGSESIKSSSPNKASSSTTASYNPTVLQDTQEASCKKTKPSGFPLALDAGSMFKRRSGSTPKSMDSNSVKSSPPQQQVASIGSYKPSGLASEYYQKYVERGKMKEMVQEDVWTRAERKMKEIDERRKLEAEAAANAALLESAAIVTDIDTEDDAVVIDKATMPTIDKATIDKATIDKATIDKAAIDKATIDTIATDQATMNAASEAKIPDTMEFLQNGQSSPSQGSISGRDLVELPQHRHLLTGDCIVCHVVKAHGYDVDAEIYGNLK